MDQDREPGWYEELDLALEELGLADIEGIVAGRVVRVEGPTCTVSIKGEPVSSHMSARTRGSSDPAERPVVGDWVVLKGMEVGYVLIKVLPRRSFISRKASGKECREQGIAANIDFLFMVMGLDQDFNLRRLERYLAMAHASGTKPVVILNKSDLLEDKEPLLQKVIDMAGGAPVHMISAVRGFGFEALGPYLEKGTTVALVGSSGAGKSTMINRLLGESRQKTLPTRSSDGKGRHATTSRELIELPSGAFIIDNPGMRELQPWGDETMLSHAFPDIDALASGCRYSDCSHGPEPGCAVKDAVEGGTLDESRYLNYVRMRKELAHTMRKADKAAQAGERARWKNVTKDIKHYYRYKREGR